jgi:hypothetical protein
LKEVPAEAAAAPKLKKKNFRSKIKVFGTVPKKTFLNFFHGFLWGLCTGAKGKKLVLFGFRTGSKSEKIKILILQIF